MATNALHDASQPESSERRAQLLFAQRNQSLLVLLAGLASWLICCAWWPTDERNDEVHSNQFVIDLNLATEAELNLLPGVGTKLAQEILRFRDHNGGFRSIDDLMKIKGIKGGRVASLRKHLTVTPHIALGSSGIGNADKAEDKR